MAQAKGRAAELELRSHFEGKRAGARMPVDFDVQVRGDRDSCWGRVVDISRSGVLLELCVHPTRAVQSADDFVRLAGWLEARFRSGISLDFLHGTVRARVELARVVPGRASEGVATVRAGCRFQKKLTRVECALLGFKDLDDQPTPE